MKNRKGVIGWPLITLTVVCVVTTVIGSIYLTESHIGKMIATAATENTANLIGNAMMTLPECYAFEEGGRAVGGVVEESKFEAGQKTLECVSLGPLVWDVTTGSGGFACCIKRGIGSIMWMTREEAGVAFEEALEKDIERLRAEVMSGIIKSACEWIVDIKRDNLEEVRDCIDETEDLDFTFENYNAFVEEYSLPKWEKVGGCSYPFTTVACTAFGERKTCKEKCEEIGYKKFETRGLYECVCGIVHTAGRDIPVEKIAVRKERMALLKSDAGTEKIKLNVDLSTKDVIPVVIDIGTHEYEVKHTIVDEFFYEDDTEWSYEASIINLSDGSGGCGNLSNSNIYIAESMTHYTTQATTVKDVEGPEVFRILDNTSEDFLYEGPTKGCAIRFVIYPDIFPGREAYEKVVIKELS